jgi:hypothetical protein
MTKNILILLFVVIGFATIEGCNSNADSDGSTDTSNHPIKSTDTIHFENAGSYFPTSDDAQPVPGPVPHQEYGPPVVQNYGGPPAYHPVAPPWYAPATPGWQRDFDPNELQGQWESRCIPGYPPYWIVPSQMVPDANNTQRAVYTFNGDNVTFQIFEFRDPECRAVQDVVMAKSGFWRLHRIDPIDPSMGELVVEFETCEGSACNIINPYTSLYSVKIQLAKIRGNRLNFGTKINGTTDVHWFYLEPLDRVGSQPPVPPPTVPGNVPPGG